MAQGKSLKSSVVGLQQSVQKFKSLSVVKLPLSN